MGWVGPDSRGLYFGLVVGVFVCGACVPVVVFDFPVFVPAGFDPRMCAVLVLSRHSVGLSFSE